MNPVSAGFTGALLQMRESPVTDGFSITDGPVPSCGGQWPEWRFRALIAVLIALAGCIAYVNTFTGDWVWDDVSSVLLHKHVHDSKHFFQLFREDQHAFGRGAGNFYRPMVAASFMADFALSYDVDRDGLTRAGQPDVKPLVFHVSNMLWHIAAALLLFLLIARLGAPRWVSALTGMLYVLHPLHTEAVAYISGRADMMSAAFMYAGLLCALWDGGIRRRALGLLGMALCFCAALTSKESSFIFPVLLALVLFVPTAGEGRAGSRAWRFVSLVAAVMLFAGYAALRLTVLRFAEGAAAEAAPITQRLVETAQAFAFYFRVLFLPVGLHMEQTLADTSPWTALLGAALLACCILFLAHALRVGRRREALGMIWFLAAWLPISGIFPLNAPMAEHWMYVPMAGLWWALAELLYRTLKQSFAQRAALAAGFALCFLFLVLTVQRNQEWRDNETLFLATLRENPASIRVHYNLAVTYEDLEGNFPGARRHYETILRLYDEQKRLRAGGGESRILLDDEIDVHLSLGRVCMQVGDYAAAQEHFTTVATQARSEQHRAEAAMAAVGLGRALIALGNISEAYTALAQAAAVNPALGPEINAIVTGAPLTPHH